MSFILDALKKLEHNHQHGLVPNLLTVHNHTPQKPKKRWLLSYLLLGALLLNVGILLLWLRPQQSEKLNVIEQSTITKQQRESTVESGQRVSDGVTPAIIPANDVPQNQPVSPEADVQKRVTDKTAPANEMIGLIEISPTSQIQTPKITHSSTDESLPSVSTGVASEQRILNLNELPLSVQQDLPELSITGHIYSNDPAFRMVNINGQILYEGQTVSAGLNLEEITPSDVIFSYKGYRFRIRGF